MCVYIYIYKCVCVENNDDTNTCNSSVVAIKNSRLFIFKWVKWSCSSYLLELFRVAEPESIDLCFFVNKEINPCFKQRFADLPCVQTQRAAHFIPRASWPCSSLASREHSRTWSLILKRSKTLLQAITSTIYTCYKEQKFTSLQRGALGYGSWSFISFSW